jgi:hypothetical protein
MRTKNPPIGRGELTPYPQTAEPREPALPPSTRTDMPAEKRPPGSGAKRGEVARPRLPSTVTIASEAQLVRVEPGLHDLVIPASPEAARAVTGMSLPAVFIATPHSGTGDTVELIGARAGGIWIDAAGGVVSMRAPATGGYVLVTSYSPRGEAVRPLDIELHPVDAPATALNAPGGPALRVEIVLHIEREGDCQFTAGGWAGRLGSRRRIEALAVRPLEAISGGEVEYKVYGIGGRETPWVSDGRLCGTRGQGLPLTGFAVRLAPHLRDRFDVIYRGAFFASGPAPAARNGEACLAPLRDDPLEAVEIRIVERGGAR